MEALINRLIELAEGECNGMMVFGRCIGGKKKAQAQAAADKRKKAGAAHAKWEKKTGTGKRRAILRDRHRVKAKEF